MGIKKGSKPRVLILLEAEEEGQKKEQKMSGPALRSGGRRPDLGGKAAAGPSE